MNFSYLTEPDREQLRRLPFSVALPQDLPPGWKAEPLIVFEDLEFPEQQEFSLEAPFVGPQSARWAVLTSNGGIGDVLAGETEHSFRAVDHQVFGNILVHSYREEDVPEIQSDWFPEDEEASCYHSFRGTNVSTQDLRTLVDSLELFEPA